MVSAQGIRLYEQVSQFSSPLKPRESSSLARDSLDIAYKVNVSLGDPHERLIKDFFLKNKIFENNPGLKRYFDLILEEKNNDRIFIFCEMILDMLKSISFDDEVIFSAINEIKIKYIPDDIVKKFENVGNFGKAFELVASEVRKEKTYREQTHRVIYGEKINVDIRTTSTWKNLFERLAAILSEKECERIEYAIGHSEFYEQS